MPNYKTIKGYHFTYHPRMVAPWYDKNGATYLSQVYGRFSDAKSAAMQYCKRMCADLSGFDFAITSYNCHAFCVGFKFAHPETGELMEAHITSRYNHLYHL